MGWWWIIMLVKFLNSFFVSRKDTWGEGYLKPWV